ncbi:VOC family protein [Arthrobacter sp. ISL-48]|uniref:VOC family protein n=1 Tax=Arthrobacter sp. ISL-48 TaxID=2819110 RepID=UPI002034FFDA|nr:VOC family protein [Arthrobacter sp. ISL-48]
MQVRDLERAATFYESVLGLTRAEASPPHAVVFNTSPIPFAVRDAVPGIDLDSTPRPGLGMGLWFHDPDTAGLHTAVVRAGAQVVQEPFEGPFGTTFTFLDPEGYAITVHDRQ